MRWYWWLLIIWAATVAGLVPLWAFALRDRRKSGGN